MMSRCRYATADVMRRCYCWRAIRYLLRHATLLRRDMPLQAMVDARYRHCHGDGHGAISRRTAQRRAVADAARLRFALRRLRMRRVVVC